MEESRPPKITSLILSYSHRGKNGIFNIGQSGRVCVCVLHVFFSLVGGGG